VALVLGAQVHEDGHPSAFLVARLELAKKLLDTGKVRALLVSGDHMNWDYDEPSAMRDWLLAAGVPDRLIVRDYAGFDTYDSCHRAKQVFGVDHLIVVTQSFHVRRAVTLCRSAGIEADGVGDDTVRQFANYWWRGVAREQGADVKAVWDVAVRRKPVFLGPHETGIDTALATP
jgi:vancomycin permeability regulator SanA